MTRKSSAAKPKIKQPLVSVRAAAQPAAEDGLGTRLLDAASRQPLALALLVCLASLTPFVDKAFHIDDPLFLWAARQIRAHPFNFYGFDVHWYFYRQPMAEVTKNPPLASYYLALVTALVGEREVPLHLAMLVWPLGAVWGIYRLAERFSMRPLLATLVAALTPVFVVSSTSVMCDAMTLCLWVWAILLWDRGLDGAWLPLIGAGLLMALCPLAKYFGMSLIPLLLVYGLMRKRKAGSWLLVMLLPVAALAAYQWYTRALYGHGLLSDATEYASELRKQFGMSFDVMYKTEVGLAFLGGCSAVVIFFAPVFWRDRLFRWLLIGGVLLAVLWMLRVGATKDPRSEMLERFWGPSQLERWRALTETIDWVAGLIVLLLAVLDLRAHRDARAVLLFLWVLGTFVFAAFVNWSINGRSLLPLVPAVGILLARYFDRHLGPPKRALEWPLAWPLLPAAALALVVTWGDFQHANSARSAAESFRDEYADSGRRVWFQGHWGFGYYMQKFGFPSPDLDVTPIPGGYIFDLASSGMKSGDLMIAPVSNTYVVQPQRTQAKPLEQLRAPSCSWGGTMNAYVHAAFYAHTSARNPLPFGFGPTIPEVYLVYEIAPSNPPGGFQPSPP